MDVYKGKESVYNRHEQLLTKQLVTLKNAGWKFRLPHHQGVGYWTDPESGQEHKTLEALRILEGRISK